MSRTATSTVATRFYLVAKVVDLNPEPIELDLVLLANRRRLAPLWRAADGKAG